MRSATATARNVVPPGVRCAAWNNLLWRSRDVFGEHEIIIISQPFHNARVLFIANRKDIQAVAFNAQDAGTPYRPWGFVREKLARVKVVPDLMWGKEPKLYGPHIRIGRV